MTRETPVRARVSLFIEASPQRVYSAFVEPGDLTNFWLSAASGPLRVGEPVRWEFLVEGAVAKTTATVLDEGSRIAWDWDDGSSVTIDFDALDNGTAVTIVNDNFPQQGDLLFDAALNATEGFSIVLADLKTFLESGKSAGITRAKAKLIRVRD